MTQVIIGDILPYTQSPATSVGQTVFMTNWTANYPSDVVVYYTPFGTLPNDSTQQLSYPSEYSVTFVGSQQDVQVTLVAGAVTIGDIITITRQTPSDRENLYTNTNFTPSMLNNDFGILTLVDQQAQLINQLIGPRYNYSAVIRDVIDTILPILGPNQAWAKNNNNTAIVPITVDSSGGISGTINIGSPGQIAFYDGAGNTLSGTNTLHTLIGYLGSPIGFQDSIGNIGFHMTYNPNAVNFIDIGNSATGTGPLLEALGSDSSIPLLFGAKNGQFIFYDTTNTISGNIQLNNAAGSHYTALTVSPTQSSSATFNLPPADGTPFAPVVTDGSGNLSLLPGPWIDFSGTIGFIGFSGTPTVQTARYKQIGKTVFMSINMIGTSNSTSFTITNLPIAAKDINIGIGFQYCEDASSNNICSGFLNISGMSTTTLYLYLGILSQLTGWTNSGNKAFIGTFVYETV